MTRPEGAGPIGSDESFWRAQARRIARRIGVACWLEAWLPWQAGLSVVAALCLLLVRRHSGSAGTLTLMLAWLVALMASAAIAAWRSRSRFETAADGLVRLEVALQLHSRLSAAASGIGGWPAPRDPGPITSWRTSRIGAPLILPLALLAVATLVPITAPVASPEPPSAPLAWQRVGEWLRELEHERLVSDESLELWQGRLDELRSDDPARWYDHASLEAGDTLNAQLEGAIGELGDGLESAADNVGAVAAEGSREAAREELREILSRLETGALTLSPQLAETLRRSSKAATRRELTSAEMDDLERRLREGAAACRARLGKCRPGDSNCRRAGAPRRGPGTMPLAADAAAPEDLDPRPEGMSGAGDLSRAALGELISTSRAAHRVEEGEFVGGLASGDASTGLGGEAVWRDALTPREREILRRYFP